MARASQPDLRPLEKPERAGPWGSPPRKPDWTRLLLWVSGAGALAVLFLSSVLVFKQPLTGQAQLELSGFWEWAVKVALVLLVLVLLLVPLLWIFEFRRRPDLNSPRDASPKDLLQWFTATSVPFSILGFGMLVEFRAVVQDPEQGLGAIAAIMVLYSLSVLTSFLYLEVTDLKAHFKDQFSKASYWFQLSLALTETRANERAPAADITKLFDAWSSNYQAPLEQGTPLSARNLMGTFLCTYVAEELRHAQGNLRKECVPRAVRLGVEMVKPPGFAYIATNLGYYANFLDTALSDLSTTDSQEIPTLATLTHVVPAHWFNWPLAPGEHSDFEPVSSFRNNLQRHSSADFPRAQVFRRIILAEDGWENRPLVSHGEWKEMKNWNLVFAKGAKEPLHSKTTRPPNEAQPLFRDRTGKDNLVQNLQWRMAEGLAQTDPREVFWMIESPLHPDFQDSRETRLVTAYFDEIMHPKVPVRDREGQVGKTKPLIIDKQTFDRPFFIDTGVSNQNAGGLNSCSEIAFLGLAPAFGQDPWDVDSSPAWGLAILSTMTYGSETLFATVIWQPALIQRLWSSVRKTVARLPSASE